jgi:prepilin signal peptidase PulO-like enzyme (type II secretory pathway)
LGDAKLALGMGWFLGFILGLSAVVSAFWIGGVFSVLLLLGNKFPKLIPIRSVGLFFGVKNPTMKSEVPFAPFLILATILVFLSQVDVLGLSALLAPQVQF